MIFSFIIGKKNLFIIFCIKIKICFLDETIYNITQQIFIKFYNNTMYKNFIKDNI